ncbi:MAG TPA: SHOCT domain-containing protein [Chloroflexota bacterium]|nr:SHOCT domain-containing protein [Chloroflexota bacterium]
MSDRGLLGLLAALVLIVLVGGALAGALGPGPWWGMGPGMMWGYGGPNAPPGGWTWGVGMALGMLAMLAFWAALVVGIIWLIRLALGQGGRAAERGGVDEALAILRRRYAAGEIDQATYERMKRELEA